MRPPGGVVSAVETLGTEKDFSIVDFHPEVTCVFVDLVDFENCRCVRLLICKREWGMHTEKECMLLCLSGKRQ